MGMLVQPETVFGYEAAGIVRGTGPKANKFCIGDRVFLMAHKTFATTMVLSEQLCERIPDFMSLRDAAASPLCFTTAIYGLMDIGRLEEGQVSNLYNAYTHGRHTDIKPRAVRAHP